MKDYYNLLPTEMWIEAVKKTFYSARWQFGGFSHAPDAIKFWYMDLQEDDFFVHRMFEHIVQVTGVQWKLDQVYANGQTTGLCGDIHRDVENAPVDKYWTFLYYANPEWQPTWGGQTVFTTDQGIIMRYPTPNSAVLFDSTVPHAGCEPTRHCRDLRVTIAFKLHKE